jgi:CRP-like cAMP-binding protein
MQIKNSRLDIFYAEKSKRGIAMPVPVVPTVLPAQHINAAQTTATRFVASLDLLRDIGTPVILPPNHCIIEEGDASEFCYRVTLGTARLVNIHQDGKRFIGEFLLPGDLIGFELAEANRFSAETITEAALIRYPRRAVEEHFDSNPSMRRLLFQFVGMRLADAQSRMIMMGRRSSCERVATFLLELIERGRPGLGFHVDLPMSRLDIADYLGLTVETVCRELKDLRTRGVIESRGRRAIIIRRFPTLLGLAKQEGPQL